MKAKFPSIEKIGLLTGLVTFVALISYFFLMNLFGLEKVLELRLFNFVIIAIGVCYGIWKYKHDLHARDFYLKGWGQGLYIAAVAVFLFAAFMAVYITYFDPALMSHIQEEALTGQSINGMTIFITLIMEGMASSFVIVLAAMQYFKSVGTVKSETL